MMASREVYSHFFVTSGHLCYGALHNILYGALKEPSQGLPYVSPALSGTVQRHELELNVPAKNGEWFTFQLVNTSSEKAWGWFACHSDVNPDEEVDKILRVSGSPYEIDSGSHMNNDKTAVAGVLIINRYDWGNHHDVFADEFEDDHTSNTEGEQFEAVGLVDHMYTRSQVQEWQRQRSSERVASKAGVWMHMPDVEYAFGRFGFDDARTAARSFLFFSAYTDFTQTAFAGLQQTLRRSETPEETLERRLREGYDFSGLETLRERASDSSPPPECGLLGPYGRGEHVFESRDIEALRASVGPTTLQLLDQGKDRSHDLLNEMVLSYLERVVLSHVSHTTPSTAADAIFLRPTGSAGHNAVIERLHSFILQPSSEPIAGFDAEGTRNRTRGFLTAHSGDSPMRLNDDCIAGVCRGMAYLMTEVLELSSNRARDSGRKHTVPSDIRVVVRDDEELRNMLQYSAVFWNGRENI